jgi:hypothetical protein
VLGLAAVILNVPRVLTVVCQLVSFCGSIGFAILLFCRSLPSL